MREKAISMFDEWKLSIMEYNELLMEIRILIQPELNKHDKLWKLYK